MAEYHASTGRDATGRAREAPVHHDPTLSCCEEQDMLEQNAVNRKIAITKLTEDRLMFGHKMHEQMQRNLRCADSACCGGGCGECGPADDDENEDEQHKMAAGSDDAASDSDDFDDDDDFMAKMRAARMGEMRAGAEAVARSQSGLGAHARLIDGKGATLASLLDGGPNSAPLIVHLALEDSERTPWVDDALRRAAERFPSARLVTEVCAANRPPAALGFVRELPALLTVEAGVVTGTVHELPGLREPEALTRCVDAWLDAEAKRLAAAAARAAAAGSDDDDEEGQESYCGRPGCRTYAHEHVQGGKK